jgi:hypothetical protein
MVNEPPNAAAPIIQCHNRTEFTSTALGQSAHWHQVQLDSRRRGKPVDNRSMKHSMAPSVFGLGRYSKPRPCFLRGEKTIAPTGPCKCGAATSVAISDERGRPASIRTLKNRRSGVDLLPAQAPRRRFSG